MSGYEIWYLTEDKTHFPGGLVAVEDAPESYGWTDALALAVKTVQGRTGPPLAIWPPDTTAHIREPGCY